MKISIAFTLIITIAVFSYVSGYSIGAHNKKGDTQSMTNTTGILSTGTATAAENTSAAAGGYGSPASEKTVNASGSSPVYDSPSPGHGQ